MGNINFLEGTFEGVFLPAGDEPHGLKTPAFRMVFTNAAEGHEVNGCFSLFKGAGSDIALEIPFSGEGLRMGSVVALSFNNASETDLPLDGKVFVRTTPDEKNLILHGDLNVVTGEGFKKGSITAFRNLDVK